jgi:hypothetical protein
MEEIKRKNRLKLAALCIEGVTAVLGSALILEQNHPYITLIILAIGVVSHKVLKFIDEGNIL